MSARKIPDIAGCSPMVHFPYIGSWPVALASVGAGNQYTWLHTRGSNGTIQQAQNEAWYYNYNQPPLLPGGKCHLEKCTDSPGGSFAWSDNVQVTAWTDWKCGVGFGVTVYIVEGPQCWHSSWHAPQFCEIPTHMDSSVSPEPSFCMGSEAQHWLICLPPCETWNSLSVWG